MKGTLATIFRCGAPASRQHQDTNDFLGLEPTHYVVTDAAHSGLKHHDVRPVQYHVTRIKAEPQFPPGPPGIICTIEVGAAPTSCAGL